MECIWNAAPRVCLLQGKVEDQVSRVGRISLDEDKRSHLTRNWVTGDPAVGVTLDGACLGAWSIFMQCAKWSMTFWFYATLTELSLAGQFAVSFRKQTTIPATSTFKKRTWMMKDQLSYSLIDYHWISKLTEAQKLKTFRVATFYTQKLSGRSAQHFFSQ